MINNMPQETVQKIASQAQVVYAPAAGQSYSHHAAITAFRGKLYAIWSNGRQNEDDCGQRVMLAESEDFVHWSVRTLLDPKQSDTPLRVLTAAGFYTGGGHLHAYFGHYDYDSAQLREGGLRPEADAHHLNTGVGVVSTADGQKWSDPVELGLPMIPNHGPQATHTGRLILSGGVMFP